jgi:hypothetical protein
VGELTLPGKIPGLIRRCSPIVLTDPLNIASHLQGREGSIHARAGDL